VLTTDVGDVLDDPSIRLVAEVMGGVEPAGDHVLSLLRSGRSVVTANKQLVARHGAELFAAAAAGGAQLRFEASVCAAIPVIKVLRESLVSTNVHRVVGIVNGTTNFVLSAMGDGRSYAEALEEAQQLGYAEADPSDDVGGGDAAAKLAILSTVAFGSRVPLEWVEVEGIEGLTQEHVQAARALDMKVKLLARATRCLFAVTTERPEPCSSSTWEPAGSTPPITSATIAIDSSPRTSAGSVVSTPEAGSNPRSFVASRTSARTTRRRCPVARSISSPCSSSRRLTAAPTVP
jgi:homoserine dehydrogenase